MLRMQFYNKMTTFIISEDEVHLHLQDLIFNSNLHNSPNLSLNLGCIEDYFPYTEPF